MNNQWEKFGKDIQNIVEDAIDSQDFNQLNKTITNTINDAVNSIQQGLKTAGQAMNHATSQQHPFQGDFFHTNQIKKTEPSQKQQIISNRQKKENFSLDFFKKNTSVKAGGWALTICGYVFSIGIGIAVLVLFFTALFLENFSIGIKIALSILCPFLIGSVVMLCAGSNMLSALKRYHRYIMELQGRTYCNIKELADKSGKSPRFVLKDIRKMINKGWFRQGHLDHDNTCLIVSHDTYQEYQYIQKQRIEQKQSELEQKMEYKDNNLKDGQIDSEVQKVIFEGKEYIRKIKSCNHTIQKEDISQKISRMEMLIQKIFDRVKEDPDSLEDIQKLMDYYLPTTVKLLEAYQQLDNQPVQGENIRSSKLEIEKTLDTLNIAFEKLLDSLFEDVAWDVSSDISVLHTMLAQEGLTGNDFKK
ncbi:MAG: 5-bromo-4-chloroindolyl phosphate hydrolysis family protein [Lachnospiraceae bacterium]